MATSIQSVTDLTGGRIGVRFLTENPISMTTGETWTEPMIITT